MRYWAGARDIAGTSEQTKPVDSLGQLLTAIRAEHGDRMTRLLEVGLVLVDGERADIGADSVVTDATVVEVLPPFAGG